MCVFMLKKVGHINFILAFLLKREGVHISMTPYKSVVVKEEGCFAVCCSGRVEGCLVSLRLHKSEFQCNFFIRVFYVERVK
jgi:hypothetical protein